MSESEAERRSLTKGEWAAVLLAVVLVGAAVWLWVRKPSGAPPPVELQPTAEAGAAQQPQEPSTQPPPAPLTEAQVRAQLETVSAQAAFRRWLAAADDLIRRWSVVTDNLAQGVSPRKALAPAGPKEPFRVVERRGKTVIAPASYARYDEFAAAVASVDAKAFAIVYRLARPTVEVAYRALGYPNGSLDAATARALRRLEGAPVVDGDVEVVPDRAMFAFADPKLEALGEVEKHLLRMGPANGRAIQAKAREIREALGLPGGTAGAK
jgi:hypothetical protein